MKKNKLLPLFAITVIAVVAAIITTQKQAPVVEQTQIVLFPDLKSTINNLNEMSIQQGQKTLTLINEAGAWKIREADGYPALFSKIRQTAIAVSDLEILAEKTRNPQSYATLGVEDPAGDKAESRLLTLKDQSGKQLLALIVGKDRLSSAAADRHGLYVRIPGQEQALLVAGQLDIGVATAGWVDKDIIDIDPDRIRPINIVHGNARDVSLYRAIAEDDLVREKIPAGKQARSDYVLERMQGILEDISIEDVKAAVKIGFPANAITTTVHTMDGLPAVITSAVIDTQNYAKFEFLYTAPEPPAAAATPGPEAKPAEIKPEQKTEDAAAPADAVPEQQPEQADAPADKTQEQKRDVAREVAELTVKTAGWVYQIPAYKFDTFTRKLDDLVEEIPKEEPAEQGSKE